MCMFGYLIFGDMHGWLSKPLPPEGWEMLKMGVGGYVVGRSVEKTAPGIVNAISAATKTGASKTKALFDWKND